jgi:hypothetical protein
VEYLGVAAPGSSSAPVRGVTVRGVRPATSLEATPLLPTPPESGVENRIQGIFVLSFRDSL